ncbi:MAG: DNA polymerase I [Phycisphaerales bacterium]|nr:DNA polymerase I [Phycisphaerales bacterium]
MSNSIYIIDGHAQIFRAYYAPFGNLSSPTGEPTRATHVFFQQLLKLVKDRKPDYLIMVLDGPDSALDRTKLYPQYKAHRDPAPEDLPIQERRIVALLETLKIPILRIIGHEADDIIATLAQRFAAPDRHVYIVSRDKDLEQLLSEHVSLYDPFKDEVITPERLFAEKGWWPHQAVEAQTLIGDPVDNVPGVAGIGPKTAAKLIQQFGTAQEVVANADKLTPKQRENVLAFGPQMRITRTLVTLLRDLDFPFQLEPSRTSGLQWAALRPAFESLGFRRLPDQLPRYETASAETPGDGPQAPHADSGESPPPPASPRAVRGPQSTGLLFEDVFETPSEGDDPVVLDEATGDNTLAHAPPYVRKLLEQAVPLRAPGKGDWRLVNDLATLDAVVAELAAQREFAIDTETTSINPVDADLVGVSLSWRTGFGVYIPVRGPDAAITPDQLRARLAPILADATTTKIGHNIKYDLIVLSGAGLPVGGPLFDTMIAAFVLDPTRNSYGLDPLAFTYFGHHMIPISDLIGKGRQQLCFDQVALDRAAEYAAEDADYTWRLSRVFAPHLTAGASGDDADVASLFRDTEMPLVSVLTEMEQNGVRIDSGFLARLGAKMSKRAAVIVDEAHQLAGFPFNLDSPKQLAEVLFDRMQFRVIKRTRTARSTDAETLETLAEETTHPLPKLLLEYRELQKLLGTYIEALPAACSRRTGRAHTSFHQTGAITGRLSSSEPNLQNIPIRTELGREIRRAFIPREPGDLLIVADYSQIELRVLAHFSGDAELTRAFAEDQDIHAFVAAQVNNVRPEEVTKEMRSRAKAVNFGIIYGQTAHGLARGTGMSRTEAQEFIDNYFRRYPGVDAFIKKCICDARKNGYVRTILGRRRPIQDIDSRNRAAKAQAERLAVNTVMQGSAADLIKTAMIRLHNRVRAESLPLRMLLQVHDELVCEAPAAEAAHLAKVVSEVMSGAINLMVPLRVDVGVGPNWLEAK